MQDAVRQLEQKFCRRFGFARAVACGFGRAALRLALEACGTRGGEVLLPEFVCAQVPQAARAAGGTPVFYPVQPDLTVPAESVAERLRGETAAVVLVHYFGRLHPDTPEIADLCRRRNVAFVEDCALAFGVKDAGAHSDAAAFSFTKSDWCYGGGLVATQQEALARRARAIVQEKFQRCEHLLRVYGQLCRADFAANRPSRSRLAERRGREIQARSALGVENFYHAGRSDAAISALAAQRAARLLGGIRRSHSRRRARRLAILSALDGARHVLLPRLSSDQWLLLRSAAGRVEDWVREAERRGITLRRTWPAYQHADAGQSEARLAWFARHIAILEIHPSLNQSEVTKIVRCLKEFALQE
jgi:dTDP-4-amino-4,6-dideoxygalactose transaminase